MIQTVAIVSERGGIQGYLKIAIQQISSSSLSPTTDEQIKLMKTYRNACGLIKLAFDDESYFQVNSLNDFLRINVRWFRR